jgi:hypothetical protein
MEIAQLVVTSVIALVGLYAANGFRRQQRLKVADTRISAYRALWEVMEPARLTRFSEEGWQSAITPSEAVDLRDNMINWYYAGGNGILLTQTTKSLYLLACSRSSRSANSLRTARRKGFGVCVSCRYSGRRWSWISIPYDVVFLPDERDTEFLSDAGIDPRRWARGPWYKRIMRRRESDTVSGRQ